MTLIPPPLDISQHRLDNGLRVVLHRDASLPLVTVNLWYHTGSKNERPGKTGFAHLFEHMLFQGSEHVPDNDHFRLIQQVGGVANGSTWYDRTNYYETLPSGSLELGLWLEADRMGFLLPAMTQEKLDNRITSPRRSAVEYVAVKKRRAKMGRKPVEGETRRMLFCLRLSPSDVRRLHRVRRAIKATSRSDAMRHCIRTTEAEL